MSQSRIAELSSLIATNTAVVDKYLQDKKLPQPSFAADGPVSLQLPPDVDECRVLAMEHARELQDLLRGPTDLMRPQLNGASLQAIYRWHIASKVPVEGDISYEQLAEACDGLSVVNLRRLLRFAMAWYRCFREPRRGYVAHTAASRRLKEDPLAIDELWLLLDQDYPAAARTVDALQRFQGEKQDEPNSTGYCLAHNTTDPMYTHLSKTPEMARQFGRAMKSFSKRSGPAQEQTPIHLSGGYDWASLGPNATVVDVGGSEGHVAIAIAEKHPHMSFVVQDLLEVVAKAGENVPAAVAPRVKFVEHDFMTPQPVVADAYLLRHILHNWSDTYCIKLLRQLIPALQDGARIIVMDDIAADPGAAPLYQERTSRALDLTMLTLYNAHERDMDEWLQLFAEADPRFVLRSVARPGPAARTGTLEFTWRDS